MPVTNVLAQPTVGSLQAAYRPIVFKVEATATGGTPLPPFVVCDIYIADVYYKSLIRTAPDVKGLNSSTFTFDIADALQEYLQPDLAEVTNSQVLPAPYMSAKVYCKFRASGISVEGFTEEEGPVPVQATKFTAAAGGGGFPSNSFFVINAALQHEDNQDLAEHLKRYRKGLWNDNAYPLTHRDRYLFGTNSSDHFPIVYSGPCLNTDFILNYRLKGSLAFQQAIAADSSPCAAIDYTIDVIGNRVYINMEEAIPAGQRVFARYKKQTASVWTDAGFYTASNFYFNVILAGDYDVEVILFCSSCINADPIAKTFTIAASANIAWRGINPFCEQVVLPQAIYVELEIRDIAVDESWFPDNETPTSHFVTQSGDLYAKFFSDAAHLIPVNLNLNGLRIDVKRHNADQNGGSYFESETISSYTVDVNSVEVFLETVVVDALVQELDGSPLNVISENHAIVSYTPFPSDKLTGGSNGKRGYADLEQYNTITQTATGVTKPNSNADPDYIAPVDSPLCPVGIPKTTVQYGSGMEVAKVEFRIGATAPYTFVYAPTIADTHAGGFVYQLSLPKDQPIAITVKVNISGFLDNDVTIRVYKDDGTMQAFEAKDNIETLLPATFQAIQTVTISKN